MQRVRRPATFSAAVLSAACALLLIWLAGLPERAQFTGTLNANQSYTAPETGAMAPSFSLLSLTGDWVLLEALRGQPIILNFWATWCAPCRADMPELEALYQQERASGLRILAINPGESAGVVQTWVEELGLHFDILLDQGRQVERLYRVRGQPTTYVLSPEGQIVAVFLGPTSAEVLARHLVYADPIEKDLP